MTPLQKELLVGWIMAIISAILMTILIIGMTGCAHRPLRAGSQDPQLSQAARISDRIDDKAVIVEQYLSR